MGISLTAQLTRSEVRGRAIAVVMNGLMLGTLLGLPLATVVGENLGWRAAFWAIGVLAVVAALAGVPALARVGRRRHRPRGTGRVPRPAAVAGAVDQHAHHRRHVLRVQLLHAEVTGFDGGTVPLLLVAYGAATVWATSSSDASPTGIPCPSWWPASR
ncbi:MFS transporter [Amycolatopsis methanolica]|uniref:MFS transporter n=1 Tax=Amycolatopsis methanolica TaxID=1814 RepID=UPI001CC264C3|nr:MFS transporter [Amycolatopsis methanolica]